MKTLILLFISIFFLAACGSRFTAATDDQLTGVLGKSTCFHDSSVQACVFSKNPLVASGLENLVAPITGGSNLARLQSLGVNITDLDNSGYLQNSSIIVNVGSGERARQTDGNWKFEYGDSSAKAVQVHTYYWANEALKRLAGRGAPLHITDKQVQIFVNASGTSWVAAQNKISFEFDANGNQMALDAGLILHLLAQANLSHGTVNANEDFTGDVDHLACAIDMGPTYDKGCCKTKNGCSRALAAGQADYFISLIFPDQPTLGETWVNRASGFKACEMTRDLRSHASSTADQLYANCATSGAAGQVYNMGTLYASIWYEIRKSLAETERNDFDKLFMQHVAQIRGSDTFATIKTKIKSIDASVFGGKFSARFDAEYVKRGL